MKATSFFRAPTLLGAALTGALSATLATAACAGETQTAADAFAEAFADASSQTSGATENESYLDAPQTPGTWTYYDDPGETLALFGQVNAGDQGEADPLGMESARFILRCDRASKKIGLGRVLEQPDNGPRTMNVTAETTTRQLQATFASPVPPIFAVEVDANDPLLDAIAITKGRFMIRLEGAEPLYLPAWTEVSRVIEDCR